MTPPSRPLTLHACNGHGARTHTNKCNKTIFKKRIQRLIFLVLSLIPTNLQRFLLRTLALLSSPY